MRRVRIIYDGREFTLPGVDSAEVRRRIDAALEGGDRWLEVVSGLGRGANAHLRLSPGVPIALLDEVQEAATDPGPRGDPDPFD